MDRELYKTSLSPSDVLLSLKEIQQLTGYSKSGIYKKMQKSEWPRPIKLGKRRVAWIQAEVLSYINQHVEQRNQAISKEMEKEND